MTQLPSATVRHLIPLTALLIQLLITAGNVQAEAEGHDGRKQAAVIEPTKGNPAKIYDTDSAGRAGTTDSADQRPFYPINSDNRKPVGDLSFNEPLNKTIDRLSNNFSTISEQRRKTLDGLADVISNQRSAGKLVELVFICTHNSRRSHMAQIWAAAAAAYFGVSNVLTHSGGTEVSAFNFRAVEALQRVGFNIEPSVLSASARAASNPHYRVSFSRDIPAMNVFSKKYDDPSNPEKGFVAIMTCDNARKTCPTIDGALLHIAIPWEDPKGADDTMEEVSRYDGRVRQIGSEMLYLFARVKG